MLQQIFRHWTTVLLILTLLVVPACQAAAGSTPTTTQAPVVTASAPATTQVPAVTETSPAVPQDPDKILVQGNVVLGPGAFDLGDPAAGLSDLASYQATLSLSFVGTEAGQPSQWSQTYVMLSTLQPAARQLTIESTGLPAEPDPVFLAEMAGAAYERRGEHDCTATAIEPGESLAEQMEPAGFLTRVIGADEAGGETVDGVVVQHYTFDQRALVQWGVTQATGEMWLAVDGGYLVKYVLVMQAGADYFGEGIAGTLTWNYALTGVNQPVAIELPEDCPAGMIEAPRLPDATDLLSAPGVMTYITAASPAEAVAFYQQQLSALGWQPTSDPVVAETLAVQDFTRGAQQLSILITVDEDGTTVQLLLGPIRP
jgi:hypothetical protein